ncbi:MAG: hypothetical protein ACRDKE_00350 [Solirubrobacterales bacterium]
MQPPTGTHDTALTREMPPVEAAASSPLPPAPTLISAQGDACPSCGAMIAADQRYCVECGERRGEPRLPFMDGRTAAEPPTEVVTPAYPQYLPPPAAPKSKWSSGLALLATIALLLLAMGVGVLIGNNGDSSNALAQQPVIIGGAATAATGASGASGADTAAAKGADAASTDTAGVDADAVAKKNGVKLAPKDVDLGGKCEKGSVGCNDSGEFDGEYFK